MPPAARRVLHGLYAAYLLGVVYLVWTPSPSAPGYAVTQWVAVMERVGISFTPQLAEFCLNIVMLVPLSLIGGLLWRRSIADWVLIGFTGSLTIEIIQRLLLSTRSGSSQDVVANTLGALVGAVGVSMLRNGLRLRLSPSGQGSVQATRDTP